VRGLNYEIQIKMREAAGPVRRRGAATQVAWERQVCALNKDT